MPAKRGRSITSFGQAFAGLSGGTLYVAPPLVVEEEERAYANGLKLVSRELLPSLAGGREEILTFWRDYFRNVMGYSEALARTRAEEMVMAVMQDEEDILVLI